ncbi:MAG: class I SAM-dependent methyltransferase [Flavobacteriales bacterium]|tara:strand:+ start:92 stop:706 length:615 start_codon:yes stop_codon:yes gene_type:complete
MYKSEKFFDRVSSKSKPEPNKTASKIIELSKEFLEKDKYVLDFGCGSGAITNKIAKEAKAIDAIDISSGMLEFAQKQAKENAITNINYRQVSIFDKDFKDEAFDVILAFNVLHYIEDMPNHVVRINSLLKPNGIFISSTACMKEKRSLIRYLVSFLSKTGLVPKIISYKKVELETLIENGNFEVIKSERISKLPEYFIVMKKRK